MLNTIWFFIIGAIIGIAHVVPGVSGGTFAVIFNVYDRLIAVITPNIKKILAEWKFLLPMGIGTVVGVLGFAKAFTYLYDTYQAPTMCFFIGIIVGSLPLIYKKACPQSSKTPPISGIMCALIALGIMILMALVSPESGEKELTEISPLLFIFLLGAGILSAVAMILPGISGSFILLVLGVYQTMMRAVNMIMFELVQGSYSNFRDFMNQFLSPILFITPIAIGIILGTFCGAAIVRFLMKHILIQTYSAILGLVAGSVLIIFPFGTFGSVSIILISIAVFLIGAAISYIFSIFEGSVGRENKHHIPSI